LVKSALLRDSIGTFTSIVGLVALAFYQFLGHVFFDALGALAAAVMMTAASLLLMAQARALIAGQALPKGTVHALRETILLIPGVIAVNRLAAVYVGTSEVHVDADLDLAEELDTTSIEVLLDEVEQRVRVVVPDTKRVSVNLNSPPPGGRLGKADGKRRRTRVGR